MIEDVLEQLQLEIDATADSLKKEFSRVRTGRASPSLLDGIYVDYYGAKTQLNQLATVNCPEPRLIVVTPFDKGSIQGIEKAIQASDLGLTPTNDGKVVRIPIPPLTEERRKELVKHVHKVAEQHKVGVREARRDGLALLKDAQKDGSISEDDKRRAEKKVQDLTDEHTAEIDKMCGQKETEVLEV